MSFLISIRIFPSRLFPTHVSLFRALTLFRCMPLPHILSYEHSTIVLSPVCKRVFLSLVFCLNFSLIPKYVSVPAISFHASASNYSISLESLLHSRASTAASILCAAAWSPKYNAFFIFMYCSLL